jgi:hypothetical protein
VIEKYAYSDIAGVKLVVNGCMVPQYPTPKSFHDKVLGGNVGEIVWVMYHTSIARGGNQRGKPNDGKQSADRIHAPPSLYHSMQPVAMKVAEGDGLSTIIVTVTVVPWGTA